MLKRFSRLVSLWINVIFLVTTVFNPAYAQSVPLNNLNLPKPGAMLSLSSAYSPMIIKGLGIHPENPLQFDFIIDRGETRLTGQPLQQESTRLIKYFLAALTVPEKELWVNLSPYEKDRIIPSAFGQTEMGRDLLSQDYMLKQLSASLLYPETQLGKNFWNRVYEKARREFGTTDIPVDTFNKIWIVPRKAVVYEHENQAFVVKSDLRGPEV